MHLEIDPRQAVAVAVGGAAGALARWAVLGGWDVGGTFPWKLLVVNLVGCLLMGAFVGRRLVDGEAGLFATIGFCGGLTSFSGFAVDAAILLDDGRTTLAAGYVAATFVGALVAFALGRAGSESLG